MATKKTALPELWQEFERAKHYNYSIGLYETVKQNENFYIGKQWEGVRAEGLDKPVLNMLRRVVTYFISMIVTDDIAAVFTPFDSYRHLEAEILSSEVDRVIEQTKFKSKCRELLRNAAVDGDGCFYFHFDPEVRTGQAAKGDIRVENLDNTNVLFGNPHSAEVQEQPYLLIAMRRTVEEVRREMKQFGRGADAELVRPDAENAYFEEKESEGKLSTVVVKLFKNESGTVSAVKYTKDAIVRPEWDTGLSLYPVAFMNWESVKSCYHGQSPITGLIPNQIFVNKLFAMAMQAVKLMAFPKVIFNRNLIGEWSNKLDDAIGVNGDPNQQIFSGWRAPDMSSQVMTLIDKTISYTRDFMGASDAALGNVRPDNTSAIIAVQKASAAPLELQKLGFYQFVEDSVRILADMMATYYGARYVKLSDEATGETYMSLFDFGTLRDLAMQLKVDVGAASYWSEVAQLQTLDNLFEKGVITDAATYLEGIPDSYIRGKQKILRKLREQAEMSAPEQPGAAAQ